jgi:Periplasmic protein involved in polysaccharide export
MNNNSYKILLLLMICLFSSCITNRQKKYLQTDLGNDYEMQVDFQQYKLRVDDEINYYLMTANQEAQALYNAGQQSSSPQSYRIHRDGSVVLPSVGKVEIEGLTLAEARKKINDAFKTIVFDAEVKIALSNNYFYVQGDMGKGQFYMYKENLNIFQALAMAGDMSGMADKKNIKIIRRGLNGLDEIYTFDIRKESIIESEYYYIKPNDVIYIPTASKSFFRIDSISSFVSMFVSPISLLTLVLYNIK